MTVEERQRRQLQEALVNTLGPEPADTLLHYLPPVGWADVATKQDLDNAINGLRAEMFGEFGKVGGEFGRLRGEFGELRGEFGELRGEFGELRGEFGELRGEFGRLRGEFGELRGEFGNLRAEVHDALRRQTYQLMGLVVALLAVFVAAIKIG